MPVDPHRMNAVLADLEEQARGILATEGFEGDKVAIDRSVRMKYTTQLHTIEVPISAESLDEAAVEALGADFSRLYDDLHGEGSGHQAGGVSLTGFVLRARGIVDRPPIAKAPEATGVERTSRPVYWAEEGAWVDTPVLRVNGGRLEGRLEGPMLVELPDTVVVIRPGQSASCDEYGNLVLTL